MSDPAKYRSREELEERKKKDPCLVAHQKLLDIGVTIAELDDVDRAVDIEIEACVRFADEAAPAREDVMWATVAKGA